MKFAPTCCGKCSKYTRESCEARDGQCPAYRRELEASGFWEELRAWILGGCKPEGKEVWRYWVPPALEKGPAQMSRSRS